MKKRSNLQMMTDLEIRKVLNQIKDLKFGWNNNGARNFKPSFVDYVYEVIQKLKNPPDFIAPTGNDSIQLEYNYNDDSLYLEIEIDQERNIKIFITLNELFGYKTDNLIMATINNPKEHWINNQDIKIINNISDVINKLKNNNARN